MAGTRSKRKRVEEDEEAQALVPTPSPYVRPIDFWIDDGNVILQVEATQFRVHRSTLCTNSGFFNDLFRIPQPANAPMLEGCPLVHCAGDLALDWMNVLMMIYHPLRLRQPLSIPFLTSIIRLGKKYQFNLIREDALKQFKKCIPTNLKRWDGIMNPLNPSKWPSGYFAIRNHEFDLINLAQEVGMQSILPALYYLCAVNMNIESIFDGLARPDGSISRLSPATQRSIVVGQTKLVNLITTQTMSWMFKNPLPGNYCTSQEECAEKRLDLLQHTVPSMVVDLRYALNGFNRLQGPGFCAPCLKHIEQMHQEGRLNLWKELPLIFGLPKWDDIEDLID